jgi:hypothetical protein
LERNREEERKLNILLSHSCNLFGVVFGISKCVVVGGEPIWIFHNKARFEGVSQYA